MTTEERKAKRRAAFRNWYYNRGGKERTSTRRRELGPAKWGTAKEVPSKLF